MWLQDKEVPFWIHNQLGLPKIKFSSNITIEAAYES